MPPTPPLHSPPHTGVAVLVGNPRTGSRTLSIARHAAGLIADRLGAPGAPDAAPAVHDLAELTDRIGPPLGAGAVDRYAPVLAAVGRAAVLLAATPTYKASYTGLLKSFLDLLPSHALAGVAAVPVLTLGAPDHRLAADVHLRPLLLELGASTPTPALVVGGASLEDPTPVVEAWWRTAEAGLVPALRATAPAVPAPVPA
jgi:FMN reductase